VTVRQELAELIPSLRSYAWALTRSPEDADELVQDTLLKAMGLIDTYQPGANLRAWLMTIMRDGFFSDIARLKRIAPRPRLTTAGGRAAQVQNGTRSSAVMEAVARLPLHDREMLVVVVMLGESVETAAEMFGVAPDTIRSRVSQSRIMVARDLSATRTAPAQEHDSLRRGGHRAPRSPGSATPGLRGSRRSS
jgi:RNA polymerase sigma factor (sigma-70 family)